MAADTNDYTDEASLRSDFRQLETAIESVYGRGDITDGPLSFSGPVPLVEGIAKGQMALLELWRCNLVPDQDGLLVCPKDNIFGKQHLDGLVLEAQATKSGTKGYLRLSYEFHGWDEYVDAQEKRQNGIF